MASGQDYVRVDPVEDFGGPEADTAARFGQDEAASGQETDSGSPERLDDTDRRGRAHPLDTASAEERRES